jgi:hypothetical protein
MPRARESDDSSPNSWIQRIRYASRPVTGRNESLSEQDLDQLQSRTFRKRGPKPRKRDARIASLWEIAILNSSDGWILRMARR